MAERFSNIVKLEKRVSQGTPKYKFNLRLAREEIETFEKAYGISLSESYKQFLERFNGGMILAYEDYMYLDMTAWEPDGPKWSSFCLFRLDELLELYRSLRLENWLLDEDFDGIYPIIPICRIPGFTHNYIFMVSAKELSTESPVFSGIKESETYACTKIASDFNTFLGYYMESEGFPAMLPDDVEPSWQVFMDSHQILKIASEEESYSEGIARSTANLKLFPKNEWAYCERSSTYRYNNQAKKALIDINKAIEIDDTIGFFYYCRGELILEHGSPRKALIDLDIAVNLEPDKNYFRIRRATAFLKLNRLKKALADCNTVLDVYDKDVFGLQTRIKVYKALGEDEKADADVDLLDTIDY